MGGMLLRNILNTEAEDDARNVKTKSAAAVVFKFGNGQQVK